MAFEFIVKLPAGKSRQTADFFGNVLGDQSSPLSEIWMVCTDMLSRTMPHRLPFFIHMQSFRCPWVSQIGGVGVGVHITVSI